MRNFTKTLAMVVAGLSMATHPCANAEPAAGSAAFFGAPDLSEPSLSPHGDAIAMLVKNAQGHRQLVVLQTANPSKINVAASFEDADITAAQWVDETRLVFKLSSGADQGFGAQGSGLLAVDRDGSNMKMLVQRSDNIVEAGLGQWGGRMQDDIEDATRWAAAQGLADPARTCLAGSDFGGYDTLMGLARSPDLYRCGVAWSATTDMQQVLATTWVEAGDRERPYGMAALMGDVAATPERLASASPAVQAGRVTKPLLLANGLEDDPRALAATRAIRTTLLGNHVPVTAVEYLGEGHEFTTPATRIDFYEQMEAFLNANIGPAAAAARP